MAIMIKNRENVVRSPYRVDIGVFKKIWNQKPNTRTEIFIFFGSGTRTDNLIGLSVRVRIGLFTQTGTQ